MTVKNGAQSLCDFGRKLLNTGLVARTWGNFSIRIDEETFMITPSGRTYEDLEPEDMATLKFSDLSYTGKYKPSSEKVLHQKIYLGHPHVMAIIHTHQTAASAVACSRKDLPVLNKENQLKLGTLVPCVDYALPTTKALAKAVEEKLKKDFYTALLLANHGAIAMGRDLEQAFSIALLLEQAADDYIVKCYQEKTGHTDETSKERIDYYVDYYKKGKDV